MSTRSGKRLHNSLHDNQIKSDLEDNAKGEKKTKGKLLKENMKETASVFKSKKRNNYVSYPTDDDQGTDRDEVDHKEEGLMTRTLRKNTLKERNTIHIPSETIQAEDSRKSTRTTRRTRKFPEIKPEETDSIKIEAQKLKKTKKKKSDSHEEDVSKKTKKKKGKKRSTSIIIEDIEPIVHNDVNKSNASMDSFYSAADDPEEALEVMQMKTDDQVDTCETEPAKTRPVIEGRQTRSGKQPNNICQSEKVSRKRKSSGITNDKPQDNSNETLKGNKRHKLSVSTTQNLVDDKSTQILNSHSTSVVSSVRKSLKGPEIDEMDTKLNETVEKVYDLNVSKTSNRRSARKSKINETYEKADNISQTDETTTKSILVNTTFDKDEIKSVKDTYVYDTFNKNTTFDKDPDPFDNRQSIKSSTFNKDTTFEQENENLDAKSMTDTTFDKTANFEKDSNNIFDKRQSMKNSTFNKDATFEKDTDTTSEKNKSNKNSMFDKNTTFEKGSNDTFDKKKTLSNTTFDKSFEKDNTFDNSKSEKETTFDKETIENSDIQIIKDSTFDKKSIDSEAKDLTFQKELSPIQNQRKSMIIIEKESITTAQKTSETKLDTTFKKISKSSLLSSDNSNITSDISRISITSDDSKENIVNMTPVLIESSIDESLISKTLQSPDSTTRTQPVTPLKREGTFTKDEPDISLETLSKTPIKQLSLPSPGSTPFPNKVSKDRTLNLTRSIEKRRSSLADALPRATKVMFCSPVNNPAVVIQQRRKVIKSNLKGSNKSFVFEESYMEPKAGARRKRSYTQSDADDTSSKRKRFADDVQQSIDRLARPRTSSANAKLVESTTPLKKSTPSKPKISRTKLPNFAALHQKQFDKMESLDECQERKARRAKQLLTPTGAVTVLDRTSPKEAELKPKELETKPKQADSKPKELDTKPKQTDSKPKELETKLKQADSKPKQLDTKQKQTDSKPKALENKPKESETKPKKPETPIKSLPTLKSLNPGYSRFGFRLNFDVNPFETSKTDVKAKRPALTRQATLPGFSREPALPSLTGATSTRREEAKRTVMREKSFTDKRNMNRKENRTIIKGVRTNRRFELQMRMRNIE